MARGSSWKPESQPASQPGTSLDQAGCGKRLLNLSLPAGKQAPESPLPSLCPVSLATRVQDNRGQDLASFP